MKLTTYMPKSGKYLVACVLVIGIFSMPCCKQATEQMKSPDGSICAEIAVNTSKDLSYNLSFHGKNVISPSFMGIVLNGDTLGKNVSLKLTEKHIVDEEYTTRGVHDVAHNHAVEYTWEIHSQKTDWKLQTRLYNDGLAFRYLIPNNGITLVNKELTRFSVHKNIPVWFFERPNDWKLKSYAGEWLQTMSDSLYRVSPTGPVQGPVLVYELPENKYMAITEAALYQYSGMRLEAKENASLQVNITETDGFDVSGDITTPWRVILLADDLNELVNSDIITNLNPSPDTTMFRDQSWIKPGKAAWYWWTGARAGFGEEMKTADNAANLGFQYTMVDEGWEDWKNKWDVTTQLCKHAQSKGIGIFLWKHSKQINFPENNYAVMAGFLDSVKHAGAVGVKVDFMNGETKSLIDFDEALLKLAAERKLMVNFHGCQQSSGEYRTYPNEVSREGIRGIELNNMKEGPLTASHNAALPFTRYVTGHADYTPLAFSAPGKTTWAHQLATLVCYYSTFQCIAEDPEYLLKSDKIKPALNFIKEVPTVWDETIVLPESKIGKLAVLARRKGTDWYLGVISSGTARELTLNCNFLSAENYQTEIFTDDKNAEPINLEGLNPRANLTKYKTVIPFMKVERTCNKNTILSIDLAQNGGAAIWFKSFSK